jgi:hypothetical protein
MATKVHLEREWSTGQINIYIWEKHGDRLFAAEPSQLIMSEVSGYQPGENFQEKVKPFLQVSDRNRDDLFPAIAKALSDYGYGPPKEEPKDDGTLKATRDHLADMRRLVFQDKP